MNVRLIRIVLALTVAGIVLPLRHALAQLGDAATCARPPHYKGCEPVAPSVPRAAVLPLSVGDSLYSVTISKILSLLQPPDLTGALGVQGGAVGPIVNYFGSGQPGVLLPKGFVMGVASSSSTDAANLYVQRLANYSGGTSGWVNAALKVSNDVSAGTFPYENALVAILDNAGAAADGSENTAIVGQSNKTGTGATWVTDLELRDSSGPDPIAGSITAELDNRANGTDAHHNRVGISLVVTKNSTGAVNEISRGIEIGNSDEGASGSYVDHAFSVGLDPGVGQTAQFMPVGVLVDGLYAVPAPGRSYVTALRMAAGQVIDGKGDGNHTLSYNALGAWQINANGSTVAQVSDFGVIYGNGIYLDGTAGLARWWFDGSAGLLRYTYNGTNLISVGESGTLTATRYVETLHTPASSSEACMAGQFSDDANFHYVCVATNIWKRVALSSF